LRVRTPRGDVTLVKAAAQPAQAAETGPPEEHHRSAHALHDYLPDGEPGHAYDMINADVVGIFHAAADSPALGEPIEEGRTLGYIEALKVRTPVRAGVSGTLVGQVAEDGQAVDFGETLFIVDSTPAQAAPQTGVAPEEAEALEPPRI
jgi:acetyl-CoA carboxylase biotin carboxyl carrier protein